MKQRKRRRNANALIGARLRAARLECGYTQDVVADMLGLKKMAISKKESGGAVVTAEQLAKISELLQRPVAWFLVDL
jgi:transcriptional regulator with XRE-family HTH domain